jgi:hypothetical protein
VGFPALAERFKSAPAIVRRQLHREDVPQLPIEVAALRLGPLDHTDRDVTQRRQPPGDDLQRHRFAGARLSGHQREAPFLDQLLDTPRKMLDFGGSPAALRWGARVKTGSISVHTAPAVSCRS